MAMRKEISIEISPTGEVTFTVNGVKGSACVAETQFLEEALGGEVLSREKTAEYYEQGQTTGVGQKVR
jgi:hypothetical protein